MTDSEIRALIEQEVTAQLQAMNTKDIASETDIPTLSDAEWDTNNALTSMPVVYNGSTWRKIGLSFLRTLRNAAAVINTAWNSLTNNGTNVSWIPTVNSSGAAGKSSPADLVSVLSGNTAADNYARKTNFDLAVLKKAVTGGNLEKYGLKPGDQKTINGHTYVIADMNPMKGTSTPYRLNQNHVGLIVIPHTTHVWNADGKTTAVSGGHGAGYANSELHAYLQSDILPMCQNDLGAANLLAHSKLLSTAVNATGINRFGEAGGCSSSWEWKSNQYICALSEVQVYGGTVWSSSGFDTGEACRQLEVFQRYSHTEIFGGEYPWLRDVVSASGAAYASNRGRAHCNTASYGGYVAALILFK